MKSSSKATTRREYFAALTPERRAELTALDQLIRKTVPKLKPYFHAGMLAYGPAHFTYASGREVDWFKIGLASNAKYISLYACAADARGYVAERYKKRLPKANIGRSCVRFKRLDELDRAALVALLKETEKTGFGL